MQKRKQNSNTLAYHCFEYANSKKFLLEKKSLTCFRRLMPNLTSLLPDRRSL